MLRSIAHISFYTDTQYDIQNWTGHTRNRYFSIEAILAHCRTAHTIQHSAHADTGTKTNKNTDIQTTNRQTQGRRKKKHTDSNDMDIFMEGSEQSSFPYILHPAISEVIWCNQHSELWFWSKIRNRTRPYGLIRSTSFGYVGCYDLLGLHWSFEYLYFYCPQTLGKRYCKRSSRT